MTEREYQEEAILFECRHAVNRGSADQSMFRMHLAPLLVSRRPVIRKAARAIWEQVQEPTIYYDGIA